MVTMPDEPEIDCQCGGMLACICPPGERAVRAWAYGAPCPPMTAAQRDWCLDEIAAVEGYERADYEGEDDRILALTTLSAWTDYCRDKGLL